jgi:hypothetical protein
MDRLANPPGSSPLGDPAAARRCRTWQSKHMCYCRKTADCVLCEPPLVHGDQPCPGEFTGDGAWQPQCKECAA